MKTTTMELNEEMLEEVNGGTFIPNGYSESDYNAMGIRTNYHWQPWENDEFWLPDGTKTDEAGANSYMKEHGAGLTRGEKAGIYVEQTLPLIFALF